MVGVSVGSRKKKSRRTKKSYIILQFS